MTSFQRPNFLRIHNVLPDMSVPKLSFFYKGCKATLPNSLSESIPKGCSNGYSLRECDLLTVPRFQTRYLKDLFKYHGAVLWNTICSYKQEVGLLSLNNLKKHSLNTDYCKEFKFDILSVSPCISWYCFYLEVIIYISLSIFKFKLYLHNT